MRALIRTSSETGAWAALERGELTMDEFVDALEAEALAAGFELDARRLMGLIGSSLGPRPEMAHAITPDPRERDCARPRSPTTGPTRTAESTPNGLHETGLFDVIVESAVEGLRKPDPAHLRAGARAPRTCSRRRPCSSTTSA